MIKRGVRGGREDQAAESVFSARSASSTLKTRVDGDASPTFASLRLHDPDAVPDALGGMLFQILAAFDVGAAEFVAGVQFEAAFELGDRAVEVSGAEIL